jgi:hypothetical protein
MDLQPNKLLRKNARTTLGRFGGVLLLRPPAPPPRGSSGSCLLLFYLRGRKYSDFLFFFPLNKAALLFLTKIK